MVCTKCGKHSHFCIGRAQSIQCAVLQLMTAVGHCHVRPTLTNTQHPPGKPTNRAQCWLSCRPCYKKCCVLANVTNHWKRIYLIVQVGSLLLSALSFQVRRHSATLQFCVELRFDHQTVADWLQFCCKAMLNLILICSLQLFLNGGWQGRGVAKLWKYMIDASAGKCVIVASCVRQRGVFLC